MSGVPMSTGPTWQSCTEGNVTHTDGQGAAGGDDVVDCTNERSTGLELCSGASSVLGQRKAVCADEDETTRNQQMFIALDSDFDPLLFDYNWIEGPSSISSNIGSNSNNCEIVNGETGTSQGVPSAGHGHPFGSHERTRTNPDLSSFSNEATQRFGVGQHVLPNDFLASSSASYSQAQNQAAQNSQPHIQGLLNPLASNHGQPVNENGWMDNAVLQTLAFNAMAAGANLAASESAIPAGFFLPTQLQQQVVEVPVPVTSTHAEQNGLQSDSKKPDLPPFLLFDAPIELRANFLACQKAHGLPTFVDNNTLHYQHHSNCGSFRLIDGRHGDVGNNRVKNEREQKRTQKIADLIDQLRENMERGGWQVGGSKSKYATLSTCAEYVKHLLKGNKEKELAVEKTKIDLEAKRRKVEDDSPAQDLAEPESVDEPSDSIKKQGAGNCNDSNTRSSIVTVEHHDYEFVNLDSGVAKCATVSPALVTSASKVADANGHTFINVCDTAKTSASLCQCSNLHESDESNDVLQGRKRKLSQIEANEFSSMENNFELDYEEVFLKSCVPQLLTSTSGRIIAWNDFFLKATGLRVSDVKRLTIFSLVRRSELCRLFEIVAAALRSGNMTANSQSEGVADDFQSQNDEDRSRMSDLTSTNKWNYTAITLPCALFYDRSMRSPDNSALFDKQLYMTVTMMTDDDPCKRCFHCVFTGSSGTNGALGLVTPELLSVLFTKQSSSHEHDFSVQESSENVSDSSLQ